MTGGQEHIIVVSQNRKFIKEMIILVADEKDCENIREPFITYMRNLLLVFTVGCNSGPKTKGRQSVTTFRPFSTAYSKAICSAVILATEYQSCHQKEEKVPI